MENVKIKINGKEIEAASGKTILEVVREHELDAIPTLCHSPELEPYASCFLCVVEVKGRPNLVPACATRVAPGMEVTTRNDRIVESRRTALELLVSNHYADCVSPCMEGCPAARRRPGLHRALGDGALPAGGRPHPRDESAPRDLRPRLRPQMRGRLPPRRYRQRGRDQRDQALRHRPAGRLRRRSGVRGADGEESRDRRRGTGGPHGGLVPRTKGAQAGHVRGDAPLRRDAPLRHPRLPTPRRRDRSRGRVHLPRGRRDQVQRAGRQGRRARRSHEEIRRRVPRPRRVGGKSDEGRRGD